MHMTLKKEVDTLEVASLTVEGFVEDLIDKIKKKSTEIEVTTTGMGAWGPSRIKSLNNCPLKFLLQTLLRVSYNPERTDEEVKDDPSKYFSKVGSTAHYILELMAQGEEYEDALSKAKDKYLEEVTIHHWDLVEELGVNIQQFIQRIRLFGIDNPIEAMETEVAIALDSNWEVLPNTSKNAYFRGIIDLPVRLKNKDVLLIDHKRGGSSSYGIRMHEFQMKSYALMYCSANKDIRGVVPMIHYIQEGTIAKGDYASRDKVLNEFSKTIDSAIHGAVDYVNELGKFKHKSGSYCSYCDFKPLCRNGKRGTANYLEPVVEQSKVFFRG